MGRGGKERKTTRTFTVIAGNQCRLLCPSARVLREVKPVLELVLLLRLEHARAHVGLRRRRVTEIRTREKQRKYE